MNTKDLLKPKGQVFLLGDEAVVRGAIEADVRVATGYPGCPSAEIGDTFAAIAQEANIYSEYSANEKVALETAIGAALSGARALVSFKHFGMNVASDSLLPSAYIEMKAGLVIVVSDDPEGTSSVQSEQDTRYYAQMANIPLLEPADPQECKDFVVEAFKISEKFKTPVIVRLVTRVAHCSALVELGEIVKKERKPFFKKEIEKYNTFSPAIIEIHKKLIKKLGEIRKYFEKSKLNQVENFKSELGIVCSGISYLYVKEALETLGATAPILKLATVHPLPEEKIKNFVLDKKKILVIEELEPIIEKEVSRLCQAKIFGKNLLPRAGEYKPEMVEVALAKFLGLKVEITKTKKFNALRRFPVLCPGCPHRATFYALKKAAPDVIFGGDIGCYMLGYFPPYQTQDFIYDMGANLGIVHGINKVSGQKVVSFLGDATFLHAGLPALLNAIYNKSDLLLVILDNRTTAMTGHQPNPGQVIDIENIVKGFGLKNVRTVDAYDIKLLEKTAKQFLGKSGVKVIIARRQCVLLVWRQLRKKGVKLRPFEIDPEEGRKCTSVLSEFACPAMHLENGCYKIDPDLCSSCGVCARICPNIKVKKD